MRNYLGYLGNNPYEQECLTRYSSTQQRKVNCRGGSGPFFKHNHSCGWYNGVSYLSVAHGEAVQLNQAYSKAESALADAKLAISKLSALDSTQAKKFELNLNPIEQRFNHLWQRILNEEPNQSFNCPDPGWYLGFIPQFQQLKREVDMILPQIKSAVAAAQSKVNEEAKKVATQQKSAPSPAAPQSAGSKSNSKAAEIARIKARIAQIKEEIAAHQELADERVRRIKEKNEKQAKYSGSIYGKEISKDYGKKQYKNKDKDKDKKGSELSGLGSPNWMLPVAAASVLAFFWFRR